MQRAQETASIIAEAFDFPASDIELIPELREMDFGLFEGQEKSKIKDMFPGFYKEDEAPAYPGYSVCFPEGESLEDSYKRTSDYADSLKSTQDDEIIVVVAHGGLNKMLRAHLLNADPETCVKTDHKHNEIRLIDTLSGKETVLDTRVNVENGIVSNNSQDDEQINDAKAKEIVRDHSSGASLHNLGVYEQKGGLFNHVLRVEDPNSGRSWFLKQYLNKNVSAIFTPPKIPKEQRADLAFAVHELARTFAEAAHLKTLSVPVIKKDADTTTLIIDGIQNPRELINDFVGGRPTVENLADLGIILGYLHRETYEKSEYIHDPLFKNEDFRDFKLGLQYDAIAQHEALNSQESQAVQQLCDIYKTQAHCVLHGDINSRNIILSGSPNHKGGVIDFEQSHVGHPAYDLSYILCESFISGLYHGSDSAMAEGMKACLENHFRVFDWSRLPNMEEEFGKHLALQSVYRFLGPSRNSWTHYIEDEKKQPIIKLCLKMLTDENLRNSIISGLLSEAPIIPTLDLHDPGNELRLRTH